MQPLETQVLRDELPDLEEMDIEAEDQENKGCSNNKIFCWCKHLKRGLMYNIGEAPIYSEEEEKIMEERGIVGKIAKNYLTWRRSGLLTMLFPLFFSLLAGVSNQVLAYQNDRMSIDHVNTSEIQEQVARITFFAKGFENTINLVAFIFAAVALGYWSYLPTSRRLTQIAWALFFFGPFVVGLIPYASLLPSDVATSFYFQTGDNKTIVITVEEIKKFIPDAQVADAVVHAFRFIEKVSVGAYFSGTVFLSVAPAALSLPVALIRSTLFLRGLVPSTSLNGNFVKLVTLVFVPLTWMLFLLVVQLIGFPSLLVSPLLYTLPALIVVLASSYTTPPMGNQEAVKYATILRYIYLAFVLSSIVWLISMLSQASLFRDLLKELQSWEKILELSVDFIGEYFLTAVFACDLVLSIITDDERYELIAQSKRDLELHLPKLNVDNNISQIAQLFKSTE